MTTGVYKDTYHDPLSFLATGKDSSYQERIRKAMEQVKDQAGMEKLIGKYVTEPITRPKNFEDFEIGLDRLGRFIEERASQKESTKTQIHAIQPYTVRAIPLEKIPDTEQKKIYAVEPKQVIKQEQGKNAPIIDTAMKKIFPPDISSRFLSVYKNYMKLDEGLRRGIFQISKLLKIPHEDALGLMATESGFKRFAESGVGAKGLTQLMDDTYTGLKKKIHYSRSNNIRIEDGYFASLRKNPEFMNLYRQGGDMENIAIGIAYYSYLLAHSDGKKIDALRKYNGGYGMPNVKENLEYPGKVLWFSGQFRRYMEQKPEEKRIILASK